MASRKEQKERLRQERLAREAAAADTAARRRLFGYVAGGVLVAAAIAAIVVVALGGGGDDGGGGKTGGYPKGSVPAQKISDLDAAAKAAGCELKNPPIEGNQHVTSPVTYKSNPPTSGNHNPTPADDRKAYTEAPPTEQLVHALEHGRIIIQFTPSASAKVRGDLKALFDEQKIGLILTPNETSMPYEVAATAWGHILGCKRMNPRVFDAIRAFRDKYLGHGPEPIPL
jgi:hypothetical protein